MSFTVICLATGLALIILGFGLGMASDEYGWVTGTPALISVAIAAVALIFAAASYNENLRETSEREKIACVEEGNEVFAYNGSEYCVEPGSKIIRIL